MSNAANPVQTAAAAQRKDDVFYGRTNKRMALRDVGDGTYAQVIVNFLDPISAQVQLDSRAALTAALQANTAELTEQNDLQAASNEHTAELGTAVGTLNNSIQQGNTLQTTRNQMATTTNTRLQTLIDSNGTVNASVQQVVTALGGTLKVSAVSLPLPSGASSEATLAQVLAKLSAPLAVSGAFYPATQPISAASLPLPAGAATEATLVSKMDALIAAQQGNLYAYSGSADWPTLALAGSATTLVTVPAGGLGNFRIQGSAATLLGSLIGGGARVTLYYCNGATDLPTASGVVALLSASVNSGGDFDVWVSKKTAERAPAGKFLRIYSSNGGVSANAMWG